MEENNQKTISKPIKFDGIGLHSGVKSTIRVLPSPKNSGISFKRIDLKENNFVEANIKNVSSAKLCTTIKNKHGVSVSTIEHLLGAFYMTGLDNALVEISNIEVPIMDGSSKDFVEEIEKVGLVKQEAKRKYLKILKEVKIKDEQKFLELKPINFGFEVAFQLNYKNELIGKQKNRINFLESNLEDIYSSRTFCLYEDVEKIKKLGLAQGGSLDNAVVVDKDKILNTEGLRNEKEFVNHKILDLAGDFFLSGYRIIGEVDCFQGGHKLSIDFLRELFKDKSNFLIFENNNSSLNKQNLTNPINKIAVNA
tara:strand:- start:901 stop:1827 length:927 start_codon:yes stop_codon:yes gene_type:complete